MVLEDKCMSDEFAPKLHWLLTSTTNIRYMGNVLSSLLAYLISLIDFPSMHDYTYAYEGLLSFQSHNYFGYCLVCYTL